jgi:hypothetical protein
VLHSLSCYRAVYIYGIVHIFHGFLSQNTLYGFMLKIYNFVKYDFEKIALNKIGRSMSGENKTKLEVTLV